MSLIRRCAGPILLAVCAACLIAQLLIRPAVGIANNGDFPKMAGPLGLGPEEGSWESRTQYSEFIYRYIRADRYLYDVGFRDAAFLSSEFFLVKLARGLQRILHPGPRFDIRWLGSIGVLLLLFAVGLWIYAIPPHWRLFAGIPLVLVWTDVAYVQYLNSFYMDTAGILFLVLSIAAGLHAIKQPDSTRLALLMVAAATLFATSKSQNVIPGLLFIPFFLAIAFWARKGLARTVWIGGVPLLVLGVSIVLSRNPPEWRSTNVFNVVFARITPESQDRLRTLQELGLGKDDLPFVGMYTFLDGSPMHDPQWVRQFGVRCNYSTLLRYYILHPAVTAHLMYEILPGLAADMRPYANLSPEDGFPQYTRTTHFTYWTNLRSYLLIHAPWHIVLLAFLTVAGVLWLLVRTPVNRPFAALLLTVQAIAAAEYALAILADGVETNRHLNLFHAATEITILLFPLIVAKIYAHHRSRRTSAQTLAAPAAVR